MNYLPRFIFLGITFFLLSCQQEANFPLPNTVQEVLPQLKNEVKPANSLRYFCDLYLLYLEKKLNNSINSKPDLQLEYATTLLNNGAISESIMALQKLKVKLQGSEDSIFLYQLDKQLAIAYLRMGEQNNCLDNSNATTCIFPLDEAAVYADKTGPEHAIGILEKLLLKTPEDLEAIWLLNLAYMTIGTYPDAVPADFLIPPHQFDSSDGVGQFVNKADQIGLAHTGLSGGVIVDDFNNDGALDVILSVLLWEGQLRYYENSGTGRFTDRTESAGLLGEFGGLNLIQADYNNDGWLDFFILRGAWFGRNGRHPNSLLRNNGDGTFTDVTLEAGLYSRYPTQAGVWADFNRDGWIDLMIANESDKELSAPIEFYQNNQDGTFTNLADKLNLNARDFFKGIIACDFNNDQWPDVFISNIRGDNILLKNNGLDENGILQFEDVSKNANISGPYKSFPAWAWDFDNDGWEDLMAISYSYDHTHMYEDLMGLELTGGEAPGLYRNKGDGTFENIAAKVGLNRPLYAMAGNFEDIDNDGWLDFFLGTGAPSMATLVPNRMLQNRNGANFEDITFSAGIGNLQKGHSIAFGDLDNDGDQDIYVVLGGIFTSDVFQNTVLINPGQGNHWITLRLEGTESNRAAIGSKIEIELELEDGVQKKVFRTLSSGGSFGASSLQQEIGLGKAVAINYISITWAGSGKTEKFSKVPMDKVYKVVEGNGEIVAQVSNQINL